MAAREPKLAGRHKLKTMRMLAEGLSQSEVARQMDVTPMAVTQFASRNRDAIEELRTHLDDEWAGIWIADKRQRVLTLQQVVEDMQDELDAMEFDGSPTEARRVIMAALKATAEELGQLVSKADLTQKQEVRYTLDVRGGNLT